MTFNLFIIYLYNAFNIHRNMFLDYIIFYDKQMGEKDVKH